MKAYLPQTEPSNVWRRGLSLNQVAALGVSVWPLIFIALLAASALAKTPELVMFSPNSDLLQTTTSYSNAAPILTTARTWEYGMRLKSIANTVDDQPITS